MMILVNFLMLCAVCLIFCTGVWADAPSSPQNNMKVYSPDGTCSFDPTDRAVLYDGIHTTRLAQSLGHGHIYISNDCRSAVTLYPGANLLRAGDKKSSTVVMTFVSKSGTKFITLGEIYADFDILPKSASHYAWYKSLSWDGTSIALVLINGQFKKLPEKHGGTHDY